jgi:hypothetical protein
MVPRLARERDNAAGERRTAFNIETHRDRGGVSAACCQAIEERPFRGFLVRVKRLWIELSRERLDLRFVDCVCRACKALPAMQIVKIKAARQMGFVHAYLLGLRAGALLSDWRRPLPITL